MFKKVLYISLAALAYLSTSSLSALQTSPDYVILKAELKFLDIIDKQGYYIVSSKLKVDKIKEEIKKIIKPKLLNTKLSQLSNDSIEGLLGQMKLYLHMDGGSEVTISDDNETLSEFLEYRSESVKTGYKLNNDDFYRFDASTAWAIKDIERLPEEVKKNTSDCIFDYQQGNDTIKIVQLQPLDKPYIVLDIKGKLELIDGITQPLEQATIRSIKDRIEAVVNIPVAEQSLYYNNALLEDQEKAKKYGISQGVQIKLTQTSQSSQNPNNNPISNPSLSNPNTSTSNPLNPTSTNNGKFSFSKGTILVICVVVAGLTEIAVIMKNQSDKKKESHSHKSKEHDATNQKLNDTITTQV